MFMNKDVLPQDKDTDLLLRQLAEILLDQVVRDHKRKKRLEKAPEGYYMDDETGVYSCFICSRNFDAKDIWYDKYGYKCRDCQINVTKKVISNTLSKKRDLWCADWQVSQLLNLHPSTREKLLRKGDLKAIRLIDKDGSEYMRIFMRKDNPQLAVCKK
jgi:DNA-directed RNA polymerase subunit RPC12/RpoP